MVEVIDGDTFAARVGGVEERVRLIGVNTPERGECLAAEATAALTAMLASPVVLEKDTSDRDRHGRLLRYATVNGQSVGEALVERGLALAARYPPDTAQAAALEAAQARAEQAGVGMWAPDACGSAPALRIVGLQPEGVDDERVRIANPTSASVAMDGWVLKDTSASHRYAFPAGFSLAPGAEVTVHTVCGEDSATALYWCVKHGGIWNNGGDTAFLLAPSGSVVHHWSY